MSSKAVQEVDRTLSFPYSEDGWRNGCEQLGTEENRDPTWAQVPPVTHDIYQPLSLSSYHTDTALCSSIETVFTLSTVYPVLRTQQWTDQNPLPPQSWHLVKVCWMKRRERKKSRYLLPIPKISSFPPHHHTHTHKIKPFSYILGHLPDYLYLVIFLCVPMWMVPTWWTTIQ